MKPYSLASAAAMALVAVPGGVRAQTAPPVQPAPNDADQSSAAATSPAASNDQVGDVIVTAQRRSESAQRVPVAVQAFDTAKLAAASAADTTDLPLLVPGVQLQRGGGGSESIFIRGVGNGGTVLKYVDGIYQVFGSVPTAFNNLASLEVDKGPQSTLFGRNATGGVVQFNTRDPSATPAADVTLGYANYNTFSGNGYATTGLGATLRTDLAVSYSDQKVGWGRNLTTGNDLYRNKQFAIRSKTVWSPTDSFKATLSFDYNYIRTDVGNATGPAKGIPFLYNYITGTKFSVPYPFRVTTDYDPYGQRRIGVVGLRLEQDLGGLRLLSITSYQRSHAFLHLDYDATPVAFFNIDRHDRSTAWTQEFQLQSQPGRTVQWVAGLYYLSTDSAMSPFAFEGLGATAVFGAPSGQAFNLYANTGLRSYAVFGQATFPVLPQTKLTLGARYTIDDVSINGYTAKGAAVVAGSQGGASTSFHEPTFRADLQHQFANEVFGYFSYNRGYNAGGYNNVSASGYASNISRVDPEFINAYELGLKTKLLDNRLRFNVAVFRYDYTNLQQSVYQSGGLATVNAAAARINGMDADFELRATRDLTISGGIGLLDSKFTSYPNAPIYSLAASGALISTQGDATGKYTVSAPKVGYNISVQHVLHGGIGDFTSNVTLSYSSRWFADASNSFYEPKRYLLNLSERWTATDRKTSLSVFMKNATDVAYDAGINLLTPVGVLSEAGAPRTYGVAVTRHF